MHYYNDCNDNDLGSGYCDQLHNYYIGGIIYIIFSIVSIILIAFVIKINFIHLIKKGPIQFFTYKKAGLVSFIATILHLIGYLVWAGIIKGVGSNCNHDYPISSAETVCLKDGSSIAILSQILFSVSSIAYRCIFRRISQFEIMENKNQKISETQISQEGHVYQGNQGIPGYQMNQGIPVNQSVPGYQVNQDPPGYQVNQGLPGYQGDQGTQVANSGKR